MNPISSSHSVINLLLRDQEYQRRRSTQNAFKHQIQTLAKNSQSDSFKQILASKIK